MFNTIFYYQLILCVCILFFDCRVIIYCKNACLVSIDNYSKNHLASFIYRSNNHSKVYSKIIEIEFHFGSMYIFIYYLSISTIQLFIVFHYSYSCLILNYICLVASN